MVSRAIAQTPCEASSPVKTTDAGLLPSTWDAPLIGEIVDSTQLGGNYPNSSRESPWPLIKMGNMGRGSINLSKIEYIPSSHRPIARDRLRRGDVLFNTRNTLDLVGKVCIWNEELHEAYFNSNIMRLSFTPTRVTSQRFMNYSLNSERSITALREIATGTTSVAAIYYRDLARIAIPLPPPREQEAIAEALSDADALIESLEALIAKKRAIKLGAMQDLLSGRKRLPGFTGEWAIKRFGGLATIRNQKVSTLGNSSAAFCVELENVGSNTGRLLDFSDATSRSSSKYSFQKGDVLFGRLRPYLRKFWQADRQGVCSTEIWPLIPANPDLLPDFLYQIIQTESFIEAASSSYGTHMPRSDWKALGEHEIAIPTDTDEQQAVATMLAEMESEVESLEAELSKARQIKQGMMQELLTGRVRLA